VNIMKKSKTLWLFLAGLILFSVPAASGQVSVGIRIGPPPPPRVVRVVPTRPGAEFIWTAIGIPLGATIAGTKGIGRARRMEGHVGLVRGMREAASTLAIGMVTVATLHMTTTGIVSEIEIAIAIATEIEELIGLRSFERHHGDSIGFS
jgi:hypothetical protein